MALSLHYIDNQPSKVTGFGSVANIYAPLNTFWTILDMMALVSFSRISAGLETWTVGIRQLEKARYTVVAPTRITRI
jgi:hypothetical protein